MAYNPVVCGPLLFVTFTLNASPEWHQQHGQAVHTIIFIWIPCMLFVMWERSRYSTRLRDRQNYYVS